MLRPGSWATGCAILLAVTFPLNGYELFPAFGVSVTPPMIAGGVLILSAILYYLILPKSLPRLLVMPAVLILGASIASTVGVLAYGGSYFSFFRTFAYVVYFTALLVSCAYFSRFQIRTSLLFKAYVGTAILVALFGMYQIPARLLGWPGGFLELSAVQAGEMRTTEYAEYSRPSSVFAEPSWLGAYLADVFVLLLTTVLLRREGITKFEGTAMAVVGAGFIITFSIGAYATMIMALGAIFLTFPKSIPGKLRTVISASGAITGLAVLTVVILQLTPVDFVSAVVTRVSPLVDLVFSGGAQGATGESLFRRLESIIIGLRIWTENPVFGAGAGNLMTASMQVLHESLPFTDSALVTLLAEQGVLGLAAWIAAIYLIFRYSHPFALSNPFVYGFRSVIVVRLFGTLFLGFLWGYWLWLPIVLTVLVSSSRSLGASPRVREVTPVVSSGHRRRWASTVGSEPSPGGGA